MNSDAPLKFGKYQLLDKIATGGMAELFRAKLTGAEGFEKLLAIKKILQHFNTEKKLVDSFIAEAKLAAYLHHPNIVQIFDFGCLNDTYYIAMEYLLGKDLRYTIKRSIEQGMPIELDLVLFIVSQLLSGLDYAHSLNDFSGQHLRIIHRDIGPQNIFITYDGQVKIIDFGIAKAATQDSTTQVGTIKGKVSYMSPEQANGDLIDHRSDIFSAGIVLYELLTYKKMYEGDTFQILAKARDAMFKPAEYINDELPQDLYDILDKALAKFPDDRYQTAEDMCRDIETFMVDTGMRARQRELSAYMKDLFQNEGSQSDNYKKIEPVSAAQSDDNENTLVTEERKTVRINKTGTDKIRRGVFFSALFILSLLIYGFSQSEKGGAFIDKAMDTFITKRMLIDMAQDEEKIIAGQKALKEGDYEKAIDIFEDVVNETPSTMHRIKSDFSQALTLKAESLIGSDIGKAKAYLDTSYGIYPENSETCFLLGKVYTVLKDNRKALEFYGKSLTIDPDNPDTYFNMGYNFAILDDYGKAQEMYKKVILMAPPFLDQAYFNLALIQEKTGKREEAVENMRMALKANPKNKNAVKFLKKLNPPRNK